jgi:hypothetical protein
MAKSTYRNKANSGAPVRANRQKPMQSDSLGVGRMCSTQPDDARNWLLSFDSHLTISSQGLGASLHFENGCPVDQ